MIVDDAEADLRLMASILTTAGHEVIAYADGERLQDKLAAERPDVLLLDVVMPRRSGYELLRGVKRDARTRQLPVALVTCRDQESDRLWGQRQGADAYVTKPFTAAELLSVVIRLAAVGGPPAP